MGLGMEKGEREDEGRERVKQSVEGGRLWRERKEKGRREEKIKWSEVGGQERQKPR